MTEEEKPKGIIANASEGERRFLGCFFVVIFIVSFGSFIGSCSNFVQEYQTEQKENNDARTSE